MEMCAPLRSAQRPAPGILHLQSSRLARPDPCLASRGHLAHASAMSTTEAKFDYDLAVIGGGSGGYAAARTAAAEGLKTVVIEGGEEVGGPLHPARLHADQGPALRRRGHAPGQPPGALGHPRGRCRLRLRPGHGAQECPDQGLRRLPPAAARQRQVQVPARPRPLCRPAHARTEHGRQAHRRELRHCHRLGRRPLAAAAA